MIDLLGRLDGNVLGSSRGRGLRASHRGYGGVLRVLTLTQAQLSDGEPCPHRNRCWKRRVRLPLYGGGLQWIDATLHRKEE